MYAASEKWGSEVATAILIRIYDVARHTSVSSSFSGVDAPGTSLGIISAGVALALGKLPGPPPPHLAAVERLS